MIIPEWVKLQPTLLREERPDRACHSQSTSRLQPTLLREERLNASYLPESRTNIATHAPARGATWRAHRGAGGRGNCNPRSCARSDKILGTERVCLEYCNPRSCARSDSRCRAYCADKQRLQPTLLREERRNTL